MSLVYKMRLLIVLSLAFGIAIAVPLDGGLQEGIGLNVPGIGNVDPGFNIEPKPQELALPEPEPRLPLLPPHPPGAIIDEGNLPSEQLSHPDSVPSGFEHPLTDPMPPPGWQPHVGLENEQHLVDTPLDLFKDPERRVLEQDEEPFDLDSFLLFAAFADPDPEVLAAMGMP